MEIKGNILVLVVDHKIRKDLLGIVSKWAEDGIEMDIIYPRDSELRNIKISSTEKAKILLIAQDITLKDISDKVAPIIFKLAVSKYHDYLARNMATDMISSIANMF